MARQNPVAMLACTSFCAILLIGGSVYAASRISTSPNEPTRKVSQRESKSNEAVGDSRTDLVDAVTVDKTLDQTELVNANANLNDTMPVSSTNDSADLKPVQSTSQEFALTVKEKSVESVVSADANPNPLQTTTKTDQQGSEADTKPLLEAAALSGDSPANRIEQPEYLDEGADPFESFAQTVDLPDVERTEPVTFGKLILEKRHLLAAEILSTPTAHRSRPIFTLTRNSEDRQAWDIGFKKKEKSKPVTIALLTKTDDSLMFQWLPKSVDVEAAGYLRNCRIKISTVSHSHWLTLRKPIKIDGFQITADKGACALEVDIPFMPNPIAMDAQADVMQVERGEKRDDRPLMDPATIMPNAPAKMYFHKDADRWLSLDVLADIPKKLNLQAALVVHPIPNENPFILEKPALMPEMAAQVRQWAVAAQQENERAKASDLTQEKKRVYSSAARKMTDRAELAGYYEKVVPQLIDKDIPVTISYSLNEQHRIVLAYTAESEETQKAMKK